ncbi:hypothetical protein [Dactylosporangium salmoneum]|uniref:Uncharacterized protein n=1 Tax=Dactylosporangium salmoneum TaxID=53361 RepID=A0ABP5T2C1_9ACTN
MQEELGDFAGMGVAEGEGRSYGGVSGLPGVHIVVDSIEQSQFLGEQKPNVLERRLCADLSFEPREVAAN